MHFDVVIPTQDPALALASAHAWLKEIGEENATVKTENCCYCHSEPGTPPNMARDLETQGYAIYKLEGCPR
ncbi:hypothetical protein MTYM_00228 [Methylococcales bacterium]|nr:hypothetical protein MTYM_00228 [Methylococcales bacterium]